MLAESGLRFGIGPFTGQAEPGDLAAIIQAHRDIVPLAEAADELGFDSLWLSEHHLAADGYLGALFPMLGAIAARTRRVVLGTRVVLAPLYHPLRLAEDAAEIGILSEGRFILGLGAGYHAEEFDAFGAKLADRGRRLDAAVSICRDVWRGPRPTDESAVGAGSDPLFRPQIWLGGRASQAMARAASVADGYVAPLGDAADTAGLVERLDAVTDESRRPLPITSSLLVAIEGVGGVASARAGIQDSLAAYGALTGEGRDAPRNRGVAIGDPDTVAAAVAQKASVTALDRPHHLVCRLSFPGMRAGEVQQQMEAYSSEVIPSVRSLLDSQA